MTMMFFSVGRVRLNVLSCHDEMFIILGTLNGRVQQKRNSNHLATTMQQEKQAVERGRRTLSIARKSRKRVRSPKPPATEGSATKAAQPVVKKTHRWHPGTLALREIRKYQASTDTLIAKASFRRLVREIATSVKRTVRMRFNAVEAIQEAAEAYIVEFIADANRCAVHDHRCTLFSSDTNLVLSLRGDRR
jgi:histone H3